MKTIFTPRFWLSFVLVIAGVVLRIIPFFGNTLASDAIYTAIFFSVFAISERQITLFART
jgi:hypothetical protein